MKGSKIFIIMIILAAVLGVIALPFITNYTPGRDLASSRENRIVVINLTGTIQESGGGFMSGTISPHLVQNHLSNAAQDSSIKGVVLRLESPGGSIAASQAIASMIREYEKPIVVSMADMAASGGYYISAPAQGIVAHPGTMTGSIGVISQTINMDGLYEMLGLEVETFKSGEHKDMLSRTMTEEERQIMQEISDEAYDQFVREVAEDREMDVSTVRELATGQIYLGSQALELGLIDRLGGIDEAIDYLAELNNIKDPVRYELPPPSAFEQLFNLGFQTFETLKKSALGPELILLEMIREGLPPDIRYQLR